MKQVIYLCSFVMTFVLSLQVAYAEEVPVYVYTEEDKTIYLIKHDDALPPLTTWKGKAVTLYEIYDGYNWVPNEIRTATEHFIIDVSLSDYQWWSVESLFSGFSKIERIEGLQHLKVDATTETMHLMFLDCHNLLELDLSHFNTENVITMAGMFRNCKRLTKVDLSSFNTANVEEMGVMFLDCHSLTKLDLSHFRTSKVIDMGSMFSGCHQLTEVDVSNFNTENVVNMASMFQDCRMLKSLTLNSFDGRSLIMAHSFLTYADRLEYLDMSGAKNFSIAIQEGILSGFHRGAAKPFTLKYMPTGSTLEGPNIITNDGTNFRCAEYVLSDLLMPWEVIIPHGFTADKVKNDRTIGTLAGSTYTWFMPYSAPIPAGVEVYEFAQTTVNGIVATFVRSTDTELKAQKPYLVRSTVDSVSTSVNATSQVPAYMRGHDVETAVTSDGWSFIGSFQWRTGEQAAAEGLHTLQKGNKWKHYEGSHAKPRPFRAFLKKVGAGARQLSMNLQDGADITSIQHIELLDTAHPDRSPIYGLDGRYLGTRREVLQPGVYVIGGKKTRIN